MNRPGVSIPRSCLAAVSLILAVLGLVPAALPAPNGHPKIDPGLLPQSPAVAVPAPLLPQAGVHLSDGRVLAVVECAGPQEALAGELAALGAELRRSHQGFIEAWIPQNRLLQVAELPGVRYVRRPHVPVPLAAGGPRLVSEAVTLLGASRLHATGALGQGVTVAVIDVGFSGLSNAFRAGEIAPTALARALDYTGEGIDKGSVHGTGVAQIVHNMAPAATLHLARIGTELDLALAVQDCVRYGIHIVVHCLGWVNTCFGDGTGVIADIVRLATAAGILWVNPAGNHAQRHWIGLVHPRAEGWVELAPGTDRLELRVGLPGMVQVTLTWDEWPRAQTDFDLYLLNRDGDVVAASLGGQAGDGPPAESVTYLAEPGTYTVRVRRVRGQRPVEIELFSLYHDLTPHVPEKSLLSPADVGEVLTVGAINLANWPTGPQAPYSSQGPTKDGRLKPDLTGPDGVTNFAYDQFWGTSAAAPHVGGAAALLLSQARRRGFDLPATELAASLIRWAADLGKPGPDPIYGAGRVRLWAEPATAERRILAPLPDGQVPQGGSFSVEVAVRMPASQVGGLELRERLPSGSRGVVEDLGGATLLAQGQTVAVSWPLLKPGEVRTVRYTVHLDGDFPTGAHTLEGSVNQEPVRGQSELHVVPGRTSSPPEFRCYPNPVNRGWRVHFTASGVGGSAVRLWVHDASGRLVHDSGWQAGPSYQWNLEDGQGRLVAAGIYLYWIEVEMHDGSRLRSRIERLLVLR